MFLGGGGFRAGPWILWQQPHPLSFAEMAYRADPSAATLARYNQTVHDTAEFMADFVLQAPPTSAGCYSLGAPMFTAEIESFEGRPATEAKDGTFELVYWRFGLHVASKWRQRLALPAEPRWVLAEQKICAPLPRKLNGSGPLVYYPYSKSSADEPFAPGCQDRRDHAKALPAYTLELLRVARLARFAALPLPPQPPKADVSSKKTPQKKPRDIGLVLFVILFVISQMKPSSPD